MQALTRTVRLLWEALFLRHEAYEIMAEDDNPFVEGLFILVMLGLLVGLVGIVGTTLEWASAPNLDDIQRVVLDNLTQMPWYEKMQQQGGAQAVAMFQRLYDLIWQFMRMLAPSPTGALAGIVLWPLGLIIGWLVFGLIAHVLARLLGGTGNLGQTLGTTALAAAPQLLNAVAALPFVAMAGVGTWTLLCRYMALRTAHDLTWPRAVWAALLPPIIVGLVIAILALLGVLLFGTALGTLFTGGQ